jgi:hypothetical protein
LSTFRGERGAKAFLEEVDPNDELPLILDNTYAHIDTMSDVPAPKNFDANKADNLDDVSRLFFLDSAFPLELACFSKPGGLRYLSLRVDVYSSS